MIRERHDQIDSTNAEAARRVAGVSPEGAEAVLVSADRQTQGRGRSGRRWCSPEGGAYFSLAYPWRGTEDDATLIPLAAGLAVRGALVRLGVAEQRLRIKWPNDVLQDDRKLAGVMCERVVAAASDGEPAESPGGWVVVGVGVNVVGDMTGEDEFRLPVAVLRDALDSATPEPAEVVDACGGAVGAALQRLERDGWTASDFLACEQALAWVGKEVSYQAEDGEQAGVIAGLDTRGRLRLRDPGSTNEHLLTHGEVRRLQRMDHPELLRTTEGVLP